MNEGHEHSLPGRFAVFSAKNGKPDVVARFEDDDVWLTQEHLARLYNTSKQNVSQHLKSIFESGELDAETKVKKFFTMGKKEGQVAERPIYHYCLDAIIALGYRIDSPVAIRFRQWATERLHELIQKGFALDHMGTVPAAHVTKEEGGLKSAVRVIKRLGEAAHSTYDHTGTVPAAHSGTVPAAHSCGT